MNTIAAAPGLNLNDAAAMLIGSSSCDPQQPGAKSPNSQGTPSAVGAQVPGSTSQSNLGASGTTLTEDELYEPPHSKCKKKKHDSPLQGYVDHPEVLDALLKITDQPHPGYGFNQDRWRRWWMNEKTDRDLQKPAAHDRVVAGGGARISGSTRSSRVSSCRDPFLAQFPGRWAGKVSEGLLILGDTA